MYRKVKLSYKVVTTFLKNASQSSRVNLCNNLIACLLSAYLGTSFTRTRMFNQHRNTKASFVGKWNLVVRYLPEPFVIWTTVFWLEDNWFVADDAFKFNRSERVDFVHCILWSRWLAIQSLFGAQHFSRLILSTYIFTLNLPHQKLSDVWGRPLCKLSLYL